MARQGAVTVETSPGPFDLDLRHAAVVETLFGWVATSTALLDELTPAARADLRHAANV